MCVLISMPTELHIPTLRELAQSRKPIRNVHEAHRDQLGMLDRLAIWVTRRIGSIGFFFIILAWTGAWFGWNTFGPTDVRFDPFPAFVLWLFISNTIQLFLLPLIMIGQNIEGRYAEVRAQADYDVNVRSERELEAVLMHLEHIERLLGSPRDA